MRRYAEKDVIDKAVFVGVDVHKRQWQVTIRTVERELFVASIPSRWEALRQVWATPADGWSYMWRNGHVLE